jgi:two-component system cell cycle response regulator PopA
VTLNMRIHNASGLARGGSMGRTFSVMIVDAGEDGAAEAETGLSALGFTVHRTAAAELGGLKLEAMGIDAIVAFGALTASFAPSCPVLTIGAVGVDDRPSLARPAHPIQIAARLRGLIRLDVLETIARLRAEDAHDAGARSAPAEPGADEASILYVGAPGPGYLRLQHTLGEAEVTTVAAFTTFTAFDYMHERAFDAVVLSTDPSAEMAHTVCSAMRRNTRLYHTPAILLTRGDAYAEADEAFARGASDIISDRSDPEELRRRVTALSAERRRRRRAKSLLEATRGAALLDQSSDLFEPGFGARHFQSLLDAAARRGHDLSLVALNAEGPRDAGDEAVSSALDQFAAMLRHCVRAEDLAVRADSHQFYLALPNTPSDQAELVAQRVCAIAECTAYEGRNPASPFRLTLTANVTAPLPSESAQANLNLAFDALGGGQAQAIGA